MNEQKHQLNVYIRHFNSQKPIVNRLVPFKQDNTKRKTNKQESMWNLNVFIKNNTSAKDNTQKQTKGYRLLLGRPKPYKVRPLRFKEYKTCAAVTVWHRACSV